MNKTKLIITLLGIALLMGIINIYYSAGEIAPAGTKVSKKRPIRKDKRISQKKNSKKQKSSEHKHVHEKQSRLEIFESRSIFPKTILGEKLGSWFDTLDSTDPGASDLAEKFLAELKEMPEAASKELANSYQELPREQFLARYKLAYMLEGLETDFAANALNSIATEKIPEDLPKFTGHGSIDHIAREIMIKSRAIGGLGKLALNGNSDARETIFQVINLSSDITIKRDAIHAYLSSSKEIEQDTKNLKSLLPEKEHHLISLESDKVEDQEIKEEIK